MSEDIEHRVALDFIRYGNCWKDADILCEALQPASGKRMLLICSAGDNVLSLTRGLFGHRLEDTGRRR